MKLTLATASFLILCTAASAQTVPSDEHHPRISAECKAAIENLCPGVQPGQGRIRDCLKQHNTTIHKLCPNEHAPAAPAASNAPTATPPAGQ